MAEQDSNAISNMADILEGRAPAPAAPQAPEPPQAPPVADTPAEPVITPPTPSNTPENPLVQDTPAQPASFDINAELEKISGGAIKSKDEIAAILERANKVTDFENQHKTFEQQIAELKAKADANPFANDFTKKLNDLYKSGANDAQIQAFTQLNKVDIDTLSPADAKILALQMQHKLTHEEAANYVNSTYKLNPDEYDEATINSETIRLKVDSMSDRAFLQTHKAEVEKFPIPIDNTAKEQQEYLQKATDHIGKLTPIANTVLSDISFKGLSLNGKEGDANITADFNVSDESKAGLKTLVDKYIENNWNNIPADEKGKEAIEAYAKNVLVLQNYKSWIQHGAAVRETQVRAEYHNPTPVNRGKDAPDTGKSAKEVFDQQLLTHY